MSKLIKTTKILVSGAKKQCYTPRRFDLEGKAKKSPAFTAKGKYTITRDKSKFERIQSYPDLNYSIFAEVLSSPTRMVRQCRTVIPRALLIPMRIFKAEYFQMEDRANFILIPMAPGLSPENNDIYFYYPRNHQLFKMPGDENSVSLLHKSIMVLPPSKEGMNIDKIGWPHQNRKIFQQCIETNLIKKLKELDLRLADNSKQIIKIIDSNEDNRPFYVDNLQTPTFNINKLPIKDQIQLREIPLTETNKSFLMTLLQYCIYYN